MLICHILSLISHLSVFLSSPKSHTSYISHISYRIIHLSTLNTQFFSSLLSHLSFRYSQISYVISHISSIIPHPSYLISHHQISSLISHLSSDIPQPSYLISQNTYLISHLWSIIPYPSYLTSHLSNIIPHISHLICHLSSSLIPHPIYLILHLSNLIPHISYFISHLRPHSSLIPHLPLLFLLSPLSSLPSPSFSSQWWCCVFNMGYYIRNIIYRKKIIDLINFLWKSSIYQLCRSNKVITRCFVEICINYFHRTNKNWEVHILFKPRTDKG